ncbi:putative diacylglycerol pyrophosphate phosphatase 1 [Cladobotryum mycophilum]|uniref:Diacylglycerol pyrophosphate phosphatase 1 n=1 Tax=Cladobotryum mycophilum TaxID=491253 RepID=A0ABR0SX69_9HYPO
MPPGRANSAEQNGSPSRLAQFWKTTNAPDYFGFIGLMLGWILIDTLVTPFHRMFAINDLRISFPHTEHERVPVSWNFAYALFLPLGVLIVYNLFARSSLVKHEATYLSFAISVTLTQFLVDLIKNAVGRPRPDLLARCQPAAQTRPNTLVTIDVCTAPNDETLQDGWRSFPSGHSSFSFAGLGFLSLFLAGQLRIFNHSAGKRDLSRDLMCLLPVLGALLIAISRCEDYRHDVYDVSVGSIIGITIAYWSYRRHWPKLSSPACDEPQPPPSPESPPGWQRVRDEEEAVTAATSHGYPLDERIS